MSARFLSAAFSVLLLAGCVAGTREEASVAGPERSVPKNVIILISDGCGYKQIEAANLYETGNAQAQKYEEFPVQYAVSTFSIGKGYDPAQAWTSLNYIKKGPTDSAAAATAMACGVKTYDAAIGVDATKQPLKNIMQRAEERGKATGVVTSVEFSHATPAGFVAHNANRNNYSDIANEMINLSEADVIMGCGNPMFNNDGKSKTAGFDYKFVGGEATWNALLAGTAGAGVDADHNGQADDAWRLIQTREEFRALKDAEKAPKRLIGVAPVYTTLQQARSGDAKAAPYAVARTESAPTLEEMACAALNVLDDDPDGFALMIESGAVDWAGHGNQPGRLIEEETEFNRAVDAVIEWVEKHGGWGETLVIVTGDHETGCLTRAKNSDDEIVLPDEPLQNNGRGQLPGMKFNSGGHTNSLLPLFAKGNGAEQFRTEVAGTDPRRGEYIDNTSIAKVVFGLME